MWMETKNSDSDASCMNENKNASLSSSSNTTTTLPDSLQATNSTSSWTISSPSSSSSSLISPTSKIMNSGNFIVDEETSIIITNESITDSTPSVSDPIALSLGLRTRARGSSSTMAEKASRRRSLPASCNTPIGNSQTDITANIITIGQHTRDFSFSFNTNENNQDHDTPQHSPSKNVGIRLGGSPISRSPLDKSAHLSLSKHLLQPRKSIDDFLLDPIVTSSSPNNVGSIPSPECSDDKMLTVQQKRKSKSKQHNRHHTISSSGTQMWWDRFDLLPQILRFISRSEQRQVLRRVCRRWAFILIDAEYDDINFGLSSPLLSPSSRRTSSAPSAFSRKLSPIGPNSNLSQVALIHHFVANDFCGDGSVGMLQRFCKAMQTRTSMQKDGPYKLDENLRSEWQLSINVNVWNEEHWSIMNRLRKNREIINAANDVARILETKKSSKKSILKPATLFKTSESKKDDNEIVLQEDDSLLSSFTYVIQDSTVDERHGKILEKVQQVYKSQVNFYFQFFFSISLQPQLFNTLSRLGNYNLSIKATNNQTDKKDTNDLIVKSTEQVWEAMIANHPLCGMTSEMLLYKLFERVFSLDIENHERYWRKCFPNIAPTDLSNIVDRNPEIQHDIFKHFLFEIEMLLDILYMWIKDFGFKRESSIDLYNTDGSLQKFSMIELVEAFTSYVICNCCFSKTGKSENSLHSKCMKIMKVIDCSKDSMDFEDHPLFSDMILKNQSSSNLNGQNPLIVSTCQSKSILLPDKPTSPPLCSIEQLVLHQFFVQDFLIRNIGIYELLVYKSNNLSQFEYGHCQHMVIKKMVALFNNLSNYLVSSCLMEESLERRSQILEKIQQFKVLSFFINDFCTAMICDSATKNTSLGHNKHTQARSQELMGKELTQLVGNVSEKCTTKGLRQICLSKESIDLVIPNL